MATRLRLVVFSIMLASTTAAQQFSFSNSGGTVTLGTDLVLAGSSLANPSGTFSFSVRLPRSLQALTPRSGSARAARSRFSRTMG